MKILLLLVAILLSGCADLQDGNGNTLMHSRGFARNATYNLEFKAEFWQPLTTNQIALAGEAIRPYLIPGATSVSLTKQITSESNVGGVLSGLAKTVSAAAQFSPF